MSLTSDDIQTIKELLKEQSADTQRKIDTATTNLEHKLKDTIRFENIKVQVALERQMRTSEDTLNNKFDQVSHKVDGLSERVDGISQRVDDISQRVDGISQRVDDISQRVDGISQRVDGISQRVDDISQQVDYLQTSMEEGFDNISVKMVEFIGDMHTGHDMRISKLESQINHRNSN